MPWQTAPSLLIIMGMFNVTIGLMWTVDRVYYGPKVSTQSEKSVLLVCPLTGFVELILPPLLSIIYR
jgi:hypothetical protein